MIPRVFHRVWLGGKPVPEPFTRWGRSWTTVHPGWTMKLWTEREIVDFKNRDLLSRCSSLAQQADIVRYEVILREGGVYLDMDMECIKNIEPLLQGVEFFGCWQRLAVLSNAVFGAAPGHEISEDLVRRSRTEFRARPWDSMGPPLFTRAALAHGAAKFFPVEVFSPHSWFECNMYRSHPLKILPPPPPSAYAVNHRSSIWYDGSTRQLKASNA